MCLSFRFTEFFNFSGESLSAERRTTSSNDLSRNVSCPRQHERTPTADSNQRRQGARTSQNEGGCAPGLSVGESPPRYRENVPNRAPLRALFFATSIDTWVRESR